MHLISVACFYVAHNNGHRGSFVHEQLDFETAALEYALSRQNSVQPGGGGNGFLSRASSMTAGIFGGANANANAPAAIGAVANPIILDEKSKSIV
jgi:hypothetical protein